MCHKVIIQSGSLEEGIDEGSGGREKAFARLLWQHKIH